MAVKVTKKEGNPPRNDDTAQHGSGTAINVRDGHLLVSAAGDASPIAIYAPGAWVSAEITK